MYRNQLATKPFRFIMSVEMTDEKQSLNNKNILNLIKLKVTTTRIANVTAGSRLIFICHIFSRCRFL
jgi:hypothetical protein